MLSLYEANDEVFNAIRLYDMQLFREKSIIWCNFHGIIKITISMHYLQFSYMRTVTKKAPALGRLFQFLSFNKV